jgi:hypothetical protein
MHPISYVGLEEMITPLKRDVAATEDCNSERRWLVNNDQHFAVTLHVYSASFPHSTSPRNSGHALQ